jgi:hypothetical protein
LGHLAFFAISSAIRLKTRAWFADHVRGVIFGTLCGFDKRAIPLTASKPAPRGRHKASYQPTGFLEWIGHDLTVRSRGAPGNRNHDQINNKGLGAATFVDGTGRVSESGSADGSSQRGGGGRRTIFKA